MALDVGSCFSAHPVSFSLLTAPPMQYAAYYDGEGAMTVASRRLNSSSWSRTTVGERVGWDSHNSVVLARDRLGFVHLSGNMHSSPLVYFRTARPDDIQAFERVAEMIGALEENVTYPEFFHGPGEDLYYGYRHGSSGRGSQIYNRYDATARRWERVTAQPIVSGEGVSNPYLDGPRHGPDGFFHLCWVWRDNPDCASNHDVCYAKSRDLIQWETSCGKPLELPITMARAEIVDPVPVGVGLMNGNTRIGFDGRGRCVLSYHKLDASGCTQIYNARLEPGGWRIYQTSDWKGAWLPTGCGTIEFALRVSPVRADQDGRLLQAYSYRDHGAGEWVLDDATLRPLANLPGFVSRLPAQFRELSDGMRRHWVAARPVRASGSPGFALTWESLPENRDRPGSRFPAPSRLQLVRIEDEPL